MPFGIGPGGGGGGAGVTDLDGLSDVALTSPADNDFLQRKVGAWANRTIAQVKADLGLTDENIQDLLGAMFSGGTLTNFNITYDDTNGRFDASSYNGNIGPADHGLIGWSIDPAACTTALAPASGAFRFSLVRIPRAATITNLHTVVTTAGSGLTAGQSFGAMYDVSGNLLGQTSDQSTAFASTGEKVMALATPYVATGPMLVRVGVWCVGTTPPLIARSTGITAASANIGMTAPSARSGTADTGLTTTAPSTLGTVTQAGTVLLFGVS